MRRGARAQRLLSPAGNACIECDCARADDLNAAYPGAGVLALNDRLRTPIFDDGVGGGGPGGDLGAAAAHSGADGPHTIGHEAAHLLPSAGFDNRTDRSAPVDHALHRAITNERAGSRAAADGLQTSAFDTRVSGATSAHHLMTAGIDHGARYQHVVAGHDLTAAIDDGIHCAGAISDGLASAVDRGAHGEATGAEILYASGLNRGADGNTPTRYDLDATGSDGFTGNGGAHDRRREGMCRTVRMQRCHEGHTGGRHRRAWEGGPAYGRRCIRGGRAARRSRMRTGADRRAPAVAPYEFGHDKPALTQFGPDDAENLVHEQEDNENRKSASAAACGDLWVRLSALTTSGLNALLPCSTAHTAMRHRGAETLNASRHRGAHNGTRGPERARASIAVSDATAQPRRVLGVQATALSEASAPCVARWAISRFMVPTTCLPVMARVHSYWRSVPLNRGHQRKS